MVDGGEKVNAFASNALDHVPPPNRASAPLTPHPQLAKHQLSGNSSPVDALTLGERNQVTARAPRCFSPSRTSPALVV